MEETEHAGKLVMTFRRVTKNEEESQVYITYVQGCGNKSGNV